MENIVSWVATVATIVAACMTASNLGARITGYGFIVFTIGAIAWLTLGWLTNQPALIWTNVVMTGLNLFGVWRWLGRQAKVEEGGRTAAAKSEGTPGETLFPVSLLTGARARVDDKDVGSCVDAMAGCRSGRLSYVVVSDGGLAGVGETLRRKHFPPERNQLPAHLTMFHALPPFAEAEARHRLGEYAKGRAPLAMITGLMNLGGGVAYRVASEDLDLIRSELSAAFHGLLTSQDAGGWRPHVTIQNKVAPKVARELLKQLESRFEQRPLSISGLGLHRYLGGPWEKIAIYPFRGR